MYYQSAAQGVTSKYWQKEFGKDLLRAGRAEFFPELLKVPLQFMFSSEIVKRSKRVYIHDTYDNDRKKNLFSLNTVKEKHSRINIKYTKEEPIEKGVATD